MKADRWFTTTGIEKAQKTRSEIIMQDENRTTTTREYFGNGNDRESGGTYQPGHYRKTHRHQLGAPSLGVATNSDGWKVTNKDYGKDGYNVLPNSRSLNENRMDLGPVGAAFTTITAPILDFLKPSRKENVIGNMRPMGNVTGKFGVNNERIWNPNDTPAHTIREQTENTPHTMLINMIMVVVIQRKNIILLHNKEILQQTVITQQVVTTSGTTKPMTYNADYNARTNPNREVLSKVNRMNQKSKLI